jgi:hypothetical protein
MSSRWIHSSDPDGGLGTGDIVTWFAGSARMRSHSSRNSNVIGRRPAIRRCTRRLSSVDYLSRAYIRQKFQISHPVRPYRACSIPHDLSYPRTPARLDSDSGTHMGVQGSIEALSWLMAWRMIAASIRRRISLISAPCTLILPGRQSYQPKTVGPAFVGVIRIRQRRCLIMAVR